MDDEGETWVKWIVEDVCGLSHSSQLTMKILENHLKEILVDLADLHRIKVKRDPDRTEDFDASFALGYQVLALFLLENGAFVPDKVKQEVLKSTTNWEYEKRWWGSWGPDSFRKEFLNKLREAVENQVPGKKYKF